MNKLPLSVAIITRNEEANINACLQSVSFAAEIVVVDCGSVDGTESIARQAGAKWFVEPWKGYGPQKNSALEKCSNEWVLVIDADERIPRETALEIERVLLEDGGADSYSFKRKNFFHGKWIKYTDWWPDEVIRLFKKSKCRFAGLTHELPVVDGSTAKLTGCIEHFSYKSYSELFKRLEGYSSDLAEQMYAAGKKACLLKAFSHGAWMFLKNYFLRLGFMAGFDGFVISFSKGVGTFLKYAMLHELRKYPPG